MKMHRIKEVISGSQFSQQDVATRIGISANAMSSICRNESQPKLDTIFKIARALNISPRELLVEPDWSAIPVDELPLATASN